MPKQTSPFFENLLNSYHTFDEDEILLKFQYKVLNTILIVIGLLTFMFATLSLLGINDLGIAQATTNYILMFIAIILMFILRGPKSRYIKVAYTMYLFAYLNFLGTLFFVPNDEFRIIWFYLLVFAAYITGGIFAGNFVGIVSIGSILIVNFTYGLNLCNLAVTTAVVGLITACLFFRAYTKKILDFEQEIIDQKKFMIAQSRFAAMGEMLSMIAHQWRQPLSTTTLLIAQEKVKMMMENKEQNDYNKMLDKISDTLIYLSDTIDDFQTYFKPQKTMQLVDIDTLIQRMKQYVEPRLSMTNIELDISECKCKEINTFTNELLQSILNIINNAIDILIQRERKNPKILINFEESEDDLTIMIEDNAGGIDDNIIDKVFEPYFSSKSKNGTGLGLYMAKMIIEQHIYGNLRVVNTDDGACFNIRIPKNL